MVDWQMMETAPQDGTRVLVYCERNIRVQFARCAEYSTGKFWQSDSLEPVNPTHWMPQPESPAVTAEKG